MTDYTPIYEALERGDAETARDLLRPILREEPDSAEGWYLAARAARNASQQRSFLERATELDPLFAPAANALHALEHPRTEAETPQSTATSQASQWALAPVERRAMAFALDQGLLSMVGFVLFLALAPQNTLNEQSLSMEATVPTWAAVWLLLISVTHILYHIFFLLRDGQTPGKQIAGTKVIRRDGQPLTAWDVFLRCYVGYFLSLGGFGMGFWWATNNTLRQGWHDLVADTLVVDERRE